MSTQPDPSTSPDTAASMDRLARDVNLILAPQSLDSIRGRLQYIAAATGDEPLEASLASLYGLIRDIQDTYMDACDAAADLARAAGDAPAPAPADPRPPLPPRGVGAGGQVGG